MKTQKRERAQGLQSLFISTDVLMLTRAQVRVTIQVTPVTLSLAPLTGPASGLSDEGHVAGHPSKHLPTDNSKQLPSPSLLQTLSSLPSKEQGEKSSMFSYKYYHAPSSEKPPVGRSQRFHDNITQRSARFSSAPRHPSAAEQPVMVMLPAAWEVGFPTM